MTRFAIFVDGSNLSGALRSMGVRVDEYQSFFSHLYGVAQKQWSESVGESDTCHCRLQRVYWYEVGSIDEWDLDDAQAQAFLRDLFDKKKSIKAGYMSVAGESMEGKSQEEVARKAWQLCFDEFRVWYDGRVVALEKLRRFHHKVQTSTDLIDILEVGHWKVDFFAQSCSEKGLDTRIAVDMVALENNYDVGIVVSGDADSIPSIDLMKSRGKHVGAAEFVKGYPPEQRGRGFSSKIKKAADFVARIYEMELVSASVARKRSEDATV